MARSGALVIRKLFYKGRGVMQRHLPSCRSLAAVAVMFVALALGTACTAS
ncbi:MAG: hypothetical protein JRE40_09220, partial [Deltaproteobacteria bacterium]|nr:hypothetical protein [Deltaproteobacteria bacterium]